MSEAAQNLPVSANFNLEQVVAESRERLHNAQPIEPKRRPGRPAGAYGKYKKRDASAKASADPEPKPETQEAIKIDFAKELIAPIQLLSVVPARKFECPDLVFTTEEATALADSVNGLINAFVPDFGNMDPKTAAIFNCGLVVCSLAANKYQSYVVHKVKVIEAENATRAKNEETPKQEFTNGTTDSENYFRTQHI